MVRHSEAYLLPQRKMGFLRRLRLVEPGIYSVLPGNESGNEYAARDRAPIELQVNHKNTTCWYQE